MDIFFPIGMAMVVAMMSCPPQRTTLHCTDTQQGEEKLPPA
jgi:hypothetical protein